MEEIEFEIEQVDESTTRPELERVFMSSLATKHIDYTGLHERAAQSERKPPGARVRAGLLPAGLSIIVGGTSLAA